MDHDVSTDILISFHSFIVSFFIIIVNDCSGDNNIFTWYKVKCLQRHFRIDYSGNDYFQPHLTHLCLVSNKRDIDEQCRPRSDAAQRGV